MDIIEVDGNRVPVSYIGDAVYAIYDGYGITLRLDDHRNTDGQVYLEFEVLKNLNNFVKQCMQLAEKEEEEEEEKAHNKKFGVIIIPPSEERYTDFTYNTLEEAEERRKFLEAHLVGVRVEIADWSRIENERKESSNLASTNNP